MKQLVCGDLETVATAALSELGKPLVVSVPSASVLQSVVDVFSEALPDHTDQPVELLLSASAKRALTSQSTEYGTAMRVAELTANDDLRVAASEATSGVTKFVGPDAVCLIDVGDRRVYGVFGAAPETPIYESLRREAEQAERVAVDVPPVSRVTDALAERVDPAVGTAFEATFAQVRTNTTAALDAPALLLFVGAQFGCTLAELRSVAIDTGLAAPATVTDRLDRLTATDLVDTTPVNEGRGPPTKQLHCTVDLDALGLEFMPSEIVSLLTKG